MPNALASAFGHVSNLHNKVSWSSACARRARTQHSRPPTYRQAPRSSHLTSMARKVGVDLREVHSQPSRSTVAEAGELLGSGRSAARPLGRRGKHCVAARNSRSASGLDHALAHRTPDPAAPFEAAGEARTPASSSGLQQRARRAHASGGPRVGDHAGHLRRSSQRRRRPERFGVASPDQMPLGLSC